MAILKLPGGTALSDFRLEKLNALVGATCKGLFVTATQYWHFVEVERDLTPDERGTLDRLLTYGPAAPAPEVLGKKVLLVTPRLGTISPWSSKATDITHQCGLEVATHGRKVVVDIRRHRRPTGRFEGQR